MATDSKSLEIEPKTVSFGADLDLVMKYRNRKPKKGKREKAES